MTARIEAVSAVDDELCAALARLLPQLTARHATLDRGWLSRIVGSPAISLLVAVEDRPVRRIVGTACLVLLPLPTGVRARLEDVVVDRASRGCGAGRALVLEAIARARAANARDLDLSAGPERVAAVSLYRALGFEQLKSDVYRHRLDAAPASG